MIILNRLISDLFVTHGVIIDARRKRRVLCHTLELPWLGNVRERSCIPTGEYSVIRAESPKFGRCYYIKDVPGRDGILIHVGNTLKDTRGCILPGLDVDYSSVLNSRAALDRLFLSLPSSFQLLIRNS